MSEDEVRPEPTVSTLQLDEVVQKKKIQIKEQNFILFEKDDENPLTALKPNILSQSSTCVNINQNKHTFTHILSFLIFHLILNFSQRQHSKRKEKKMHFAW